MLLCLRLSTFVAIYMQFEFASATRRVRRNKSILCDSLKAYTFRFCMNFSTIIFTKDLKYNTRMVLFGCFWSFILTFWHLAISDFPCSHSQWERIVWIDHVCTMECTKCSMPAISVNFWGEEANALQILCWKFEREQLPGWKQMVYCSCFLLFGHIRIA